jgi:hypothetical protein
MWLATNVTHVPDRTRFVAPRHGENSTVSHYAEQFSVLLILDLRVAKEPPGLLKNAC